MISPYSVSSHERVILRNYYLAMKICQAVNTYFPNEFAPCTLCHARCALVSSFSSVSCGRFWRLPCGGYSGTRSPNCGSGGGESLGDVSLGGGFLQGGSHDAKSNYGSLEDEYRGARPGTRSDGRCSGDRFCKLLCSQFCFISFFSIIFCRFRYCCLSISSSALITSFSRRSFCCCSLCFSYWSITSLASSR